MPGLACEKNHCQFTIQFEGKFETISGNLLSLLGSQIKDIGAALQMLLTGATILEKTVEKIVYLDSIFLNIVASPESNVVVYSKESLIPGRLWEATLNWGKGFSFHKGVVLEIVLLRRKVDMMGKTFSSSFVRDCSIY